MNHGPFPLLKFHASPLVETWLLKKRKIVLKPSSQIFHRRWRSSGFNQDRKQVNFFIFLLLVIADGTTLILKRYSVFHTKLKNIKTFPVF